MADRVRERRLLAPEDRVGQVSKPLERVPEQVLPFSVRIHLDRGVERHHVLDEIKVSERDPRLERVDRNAAVCAQDVVHVEFRDPLLGFLLE